MGFLGALVVVCMLAGAAEAAPATTRVLASDVPTAVPAVDGPDAPVGPSRTASRPRPEITAVAVDLVIRRGGERRPDGARIRTGGAWVEGVARYTLAAPTQGPAKVVLLDFASSMTKEPTHLDEVTLANYVDGPFDSGSLALTGHWGPTEVSRTQHGLLVELPAGVAEFTLRYAIDVPHRYWPFGCVLDRCSLAGAIAPLPSALAKGGAYLPPSGRVVAPAHWTVTATFATPGAMRPGAKVGSKPRRKPDEVIVVGGDGRSTPYASVFFGPAWAETDRHRLGMHVKVRTIHRRPSAQVPDEAKGEFRHDIAGIVHMLANEAIDLFAVLGAPPVPDEPLFVVEGPLRSSVAEFHPGVVLVSDQAFELLPIERFRKFHEDAIARALIDGLAELRLRGKHDPSTSFWLSGAVGFAVLQLWRGVREQRDEFAHDILSRLTFMPAVDRFLYTQQGSFSSTYFRGIEDAPPIRNHALWFAHELPTGRRIHEKFVDTLGAAMTDRFYRDLFADPSAEPRALAERVWGRSLGWFFDQWLGPYPSVNYSIVDVRSKRVDSGWEHTIVVEKDGTAPVVEPVQLLVTARGKEAHYLVWNGELGEHNESLSDEPRKGRHTFVVRTKKRLSNVRVDPRTRLRETPQAPHANVDPIFDNRVPKSFRFLYTGVGLSIAASEFVSAATATGRLNAISGFVSFESSLRRDLRYTGHVNIARDRETDISLGTGANVWFGRKVNLQRRRSRVRFFETVSLLNGRSLDPRGGVRLIERIALIDDTRGFVWWPEKGYSLGISASARHTLRTEGEKDHRHDLQFDASWVHLWRIAKDHVIASSLFVEMVVPLVGDPEFRSLGRVGGIGGLSGYGGDEVFGLGIASLQLEYRHVFVNDLPINLVHLAWLRSIGGVLFGGVSTHSHCEDYGGWFSAKSWYGSIGYALTGYLSILGVTPQLVRLEVAAPLVRRTGVPCLGEQLPAYLAEVQGVDDPDRLLPPVQVNLTFQQTF